MSISLRVTRTWISVCLVLSEIFWKFINEGSWGATRLRQLLFQMGKHFYGDFPDVATGLRRGLFEPHAMSRVVPAFQIGQNVHWRRLQIWKAFTSRDDNHVEKVLAVIHQNRHLTVREVAEEVGISKRPCHLTLTVKRKMRRVVAIFVPPFLTRHSLSMNFWRSTRRLLSPNRPTFQIWPLRPCSCSRSGYPHQKVADFRR